MTEDEEDRLNHLMLNSRSVEDVIELLGLMHKGLEDGRFDVDNSATLEYVGALERMVVFVAKRAEKAGKPIDESTWEMLSEIFGKALFIT